MYARLTIGQLVDARCAEIDLLRMGTEGALRIAKEVLSDLGLSNLLQICFVSIDAASRLVQFYHYGLACARPLSVKSSEHVTV